MAVVHDLAVLHLDERMQVVRLAEGVGLGHRLEVIDDVGWRLVVMGDAHRERNLGQPFYGFRRDPRYGCDGRLEPHGLSSLGLDAKG